MFIVSCAPSGEDTIKTTASSSTAVTGATAAASGLTESDVNTALSEQGFIWAARFTDPADLEVLGASGIYIAVEEIFEFVTPTSVDVSLTGFDATTSYPAVGGIFSFDWRLDFATNQLFFTNVQSQEISRFKNLNYVVLNGKVTEIHCQSDDNRNFFLIKRAK